MTPGPIVVRKCSACGEFIEHGTFGSGNTCGARFWTDGKPDAPMMPDFPALLKCSHCEVLVWIDEQEEVERRRVWESPSANAAPAWPCQVPSAADYSAALARGIADKRKERYVRLRLWWLGNDERRGGKLVIPLSDHEKANLQALAALMNESVAEDRLMKAEALRELGRYDEAMVLLSQPFDDYLAPAAAMIRDLAVKQVPIVQEIKAAR